MWIRTLDLNTSINERKQFCMQMCPETEAATRRRCFFELTPHHHSRPQASAAVLGKGSSRRGGERKSSEGGGGRLSQREKKRTASSLGVSTVPMVKQYMRTGSQMNVPPSQIRPPDVLLGTVRYLIRDIATRTDVSFLKVYQFVCNRFRSVRQDFLLYRAATRLDQKTNTKQDRKEDFGVLLLKVECLELMARFLIHASYQLFEESSIDFDRVLHGKQISDCLISLRHLYQENRNLNEKSKGLPNEAEFGSYMLLATPFHDWRHTTMERPLPTGGPLAGARAIRQRQHQQRSGGTDSCIRLPYHARAWYCDGNFHMFFSALRRKAGYFQAILLHDYAHALRVHALRTIQRTYKIGIPLAALTRMLGFQAEGETIKFLDPLALERVQKNGVTVYKFGKTGLGADLVNQLPPIKINLGHPHLAKLSLDTKVCGQAGVLTPPSLVARAREVLLRSLHASGVGVPGNVLGIIHEFWSYEMEFR